MAKSPPPVQLEVPQHLAGQRLDRVLDELVPQLSRARLQKLVRRGGVAVGGRRVARSNQGVRAGQRIALWLEGADLHEVRPLVVLFADGDLVVLDKPAGVVTHGSDRYPTGSVAEDAARLYGPLPVGMGEDRPGVVHRLDRQTSGVLVLARTDAAMESLREQFRERSVTKTYFALVHGEPREEAGSVERPLAPDPANADVQRLAPAGEGREALTRWAVAERFEGVTRLECHPVTGRRHQIRVHLASIGLPIVGDEMYRSSGAAPLPEGAPRPGRQTLHAARLELHHPRTGQRVAFEAPLPEDLAAFLAWLREARGTGRRA